MYIINCSFNHLATWRCGKSSVITLSSLNFVHSIDVTGLNNITRNYKKQITFILYVRKYNTILNQGKTWLQKQDQ